MPTLPVEWRAQFSDIISFQPARIPPPDRVRKSRYIATPHKVGRPVEFGRTKNQGGNRRWRDAGALEPASAGSAQGRGFEGRKEAQKTQKEKGKKMEAKR